MEETSNLIEPLIPKQQSPEIFKQFQSDQAQKDGCSICYESFEEGDQFSLHERGEHKIHKQCLIDYYITMIDNNKIDKLVCPVFQCDLKINKNQTDNLLDNAYQEKLNEMQTAKNVAKSQGQKFHCPTADCKGIFDQNDFKLFQLKVPCNICQKLICTSCKQLWHEGVKCAKFDAKAFEWEGLGDGQQGKASRCPKCLCPFEKIDGCMHMKCSMCEYEWCWVCGLKYNSWFHYGQAGGLMCEMIGQTSFNPQRGVCFRVFGLIGMFIFLPVILVVFCAIGGFGGAGVLISKCFCSKLICDFKRTSRSIERCVQFKLIYYMLLLVFSLLYLIYVIMIYTVVFVLFLVMGVSIFALTYIMLLVPCYIAFVIVVIRKQMVWDEQAPQNQTNLHANKSGQQILTAVENNTGNISIQQDQSSKL